MPFVTVYQRSRSTDHKRDLVRRITDAFVEAYELPAETVQVCIQEIPDDNFGTAGKLYAD